MRTTLTTINSREDQMNAIAETTNWAFSTTSASYEAIAELFELCDKFDIHYENDERILANSFMKNESAERKTLIALGHYVEDIDQKMEAATGEKFYQGSIGLYPNSSHQFCAATIYDLAGMC